MMLRTRQRTFVDRCGPPLQERKNTIGIAPTGAGKTIMLAAVALENAPKDMPSLILQHRDELVDQNCKKFVQYAGITKIRRPMLINADTKAWDRSAKGWNFGMIQTIIRNLDAMPPLGFLGIDEAHHAASPSYLQLIARAKQLNPNLIIYGTTATPNRGDRKALRTVFDNCGDQIQIGELIRDGHLVRPRTFVIDIGVNDELKRVRRTAVDFDQKEVAAVLNKSILNDKIIEKWREKAGDRQTVVFCSTTEHMIDFTAALQAHGISAAYLGDNPTKSERRDVLGRYDRGELQVVVNVAILTEGWDHQPTSCVMLLRMSSWKSTMVQMIGRGLRKVDPEIYPGVTKDDCIVLDFGTSCLTHGSLEEEPDLNGRGTKMCPDCDSTVPMSSKECPICGHEFPMELVCRPAGGGGGEPAADGGVLDNFIMSEIDILQDSPFKYESFWDGRLMMCFGFNYWAAVVHYQDQRYYAIGAEAADESGRSYQLHVRNSSDNYLIALQSADDFMRTKGNKTDARRVAQWLYEPATAKQLQLLAEGGSMGMNKYRASCAIQFKFYGGQIRGAIQGFIEANHNNQHRYGA